MANLEWAVPHRITTIEGSIDLNVPDPVTGRVYRIQPDSYKMVPSLRVTQDNISQADGSVLHPRWKSGLTAVMQVALNIQIDPDSPDFEPACGQDLREMGEELVLQLNSIREIVSDNQRLIWTPTGYGDTRLLLDVELLSIWDPSYDLNGLEALIAFAVETPFPYAIDATEIDTDISASGTVTITNLGNAEQSPVVKVYGPTTAFTITNLDDLDTLGNPLQLVYDSTLPGAVSIPAAHYAEIDFFRGTIFKDGSGINLIAGISPTDSDFWHLVPGGNDVNIVGADCTVLSNNAWA